MARKTISLTGELHMNATGFSVTVDALETLKIVGIAYGVYDHAEDLRDCRVTLENGERTALVVQEDVSLHGSPFWETDPAICGISGNAKNVPTDRTGARSCATGYRPQQSTGRSRQEEGLP